MSKLEDSSGRGSAIAVIDLGDFACQPSARFGHQPYSLRSLGGARLFQRMARRLSDCQLLSDIYIVGSNVPEHVIRGGFPNLKTCMMPTVHVTDRVGAAVDSSGAQWCVYMPANRPFVDASLIDQLLANTTDDDCDFIGFGSDCGADHTLALGLSGEVFHADAIRRLRRNADRLPPMDGQSIVSCLADAPGAFHLKFVPLPAELDRSDLRFTINNEMDWDDAQVLCDSVTEVDSFWRDLVGLVSRNEVLRHSMQSRNDMASV